MNIQYRISNIQYSVLDIHQKFSAEPFDGARQGGGLAHATGARDQELALRLAEDAHDAAQLPGAVREIGTGDDASDPEGITSRPGGIWHYVINLLVICSLGNR